MDAKLEKLTGFEKCGKCGGKGWIRSYIHIENGKCFECGGTGRGASARTIFTLFAGAFEDDGTVSVAQESTWRSLEEAIEAATGTGAEYTQITIKVKRKDKVVWESEDYWGIEHKL